MLQLLPFLKYERAKSDQWPKFLKFTFSPIFNGLKV